MSANSHQSLLKSSEKRFITSRFEPYTKKKNIIKGINSKSITTLQRIHHFHSWEIKDCDNVLRMKTIQSSPFIIEHFDGKWYLKLSYEENLNSSPKSHYTYSLSLHFDGELQVFPIDFELGFINTNNDFFLYHEEKSTLSKCLGGKVFQTLKKLQKCSLKIGCRITLMKPATSSSMNGINLESSSFDLANDLSRLLKNKETADISLLVGTRRFRAHKAILIARSSFFATILKDHLKEYMKMKIIIAELSAEVIEAVLTFIYTDNVEDYEAIADDLLWAADKYNLEKLKIMCEKTIADKVNVENAAEILVLADRCKAHRLKAHVSYFIKSVMKEVVGTESFKKMKKSHPQMFLEIIKDLVIL